MLSGDHWRAGSSLCPSDVHQPFSPPRSAASASLCNGQPCSLPHFLECHLCFCFMFQMVFFHRCSDLWIRIEQWGIIMVVIGIIALFLAPWEVCTYFLVEGISANDALFIRRLTYSSRLNEFVFQLFSGRSHCLLSYWAFLSGMAILLFSCYDAHSGILHLARDKFYNIFLNNHAFMEWLTRDQGGIFKCSVGFRLFSNVYLRS